MSRVRAGLIAVVVFGVSLAIGAQIVFPGFTSYSSAVGNSFAAGTVALSDNDAGRSTVTLTNARPGTTSTGCISVQYVGTLDSTVGLYGTVSGSLAQYVQLKVERGTLSGAFPSCTNFVLDSTNYRGLGAGVLYNGTLSAYPTSLATSITDPATTWQNSNSHGYRLTVTLNTNDLAQGLTASASFLWGAKNK